MLANESPYYLQHHQASVRGVAFHPKDRYLFGAGDVDGKVNLYSAKTYDLIHTYSITLATMPPAKTINAVRFAGDGTKILATTCAKRLAVIDLEKGCQEVTYENCAFRGRNRTGLAYNPARSNIVACCNVTGTGLSIFDLRMAQPMKALTNLHSGTIRDFFFLHDSWPWGRGQQTIVTVASDGSCRVNTLDGGLVHNIEIGQPLHSATFTPELYQKSGTNGFNNLLVIGGTSISTYRPDFGIQQTMQESLNNPVWKMRYNAHGSTLYTACDGGVVRKYRRNQTKHQYVKDLFTHKGDIQDMDISSYDEFLVTASKDNSVGIMNISSTNHGTSEYCELT